MALKSPRPQPRRQSLFGVDRLKRCADIFTHLPFVSTFIPNSASSTTIGHNFNSPTPITRIPRRSPKGETFRLRSRVVTPAQNIIRQYRQNEDSRITNNATNVDRSSTSPTAEEPCLADDPVNLEDLCVVSRSPVHSIVPPSQESRIKFRRDGHHEAELRFARHEVDEMSNGVYPLRCGRPGCNDLLRDARALSFHLHIHIIHESMTGCDHRGAKFDRETSNHF